MKNNKNEFTVRSLILQIIGIVFASISFAILYDSILDRAEGKSDSVTRSFISRVKGMSTILLEGSSVQNEVYYERNGNEIIVDLRGKCNGNDVTVTSDKGITVKCKNEEIKIDENCNVKKYEVRNGILIIHC